MEFYRTFIGLPVKVGKGFLEARQELIKSLAGERISWVDPGRYHITLRFIGDTQISDLEAVRETLENEVVLPGKTQLQLSHVGSFGPRKKPRVIWVGFENNAMFESLKVTVDEALQKCGITSTDQPFRAHLTLGRVRSLKDLSGFYNVITDVKDRFKELLLFERLVFYRSELGFGEPSYTSLYQ